MRNFLCIYIEEKSVVKVRVDAFIMFEFFQPHTYFVLFLFPNIICYKHNHTKIAITYSLTSKSRLKALLMQDQHLRLSHVYRHGRLLLP